MPMLYKMRLAWMAFKMLDGRFCELDLWYNFCSPFGRSFHNFYSKPNFDQDCFDQHKAREHSSKTYIHL